jgi:hypothetical protein
MAWERYILPVIVFAVGIALLGVYAKEPETSNYKKTYKSWGIVGMVLGAVMIGLTWYFRPYEYSPPPRPQVQMTPRTPAVVQTANEAVERINNAANKAIKQINNQVAPIESAVVEQPNGGRNFGRRNNMMTPQ